MEILYFVLFFAMWVGIGYLVFYFRFDNRQIIDELRSNLKNCKKEFDMASAELQENVHQNMILKDKVTELFEKNDDLSRIVSELSRYYYHIKMWAEKAAELSKILNVSNQEMEEKMKRTLWPKFDMWSPIDNKIQIAFDGKTQSDKKFF